MLVNITWLMAGGLQLLIAVVGVLLGVEGQTREGLKRLCRSVLKLLRDNGAAWTICYLKEAYILTVHFVAGNRARSCEGPVWVSLVSGLPKVIPGALRAHMRARNVFVTRLVLSILGLYRIIALDGKIKIETITGPFTGTLETLPRFMAYVPFFARAVGGSLASIRRPRLYLNTSAGPNGGPSILWSIFDARILHGDKPFYALFRHFVQTLYGRHWILVGIPVLAFLAKALGLGSSQGSTSRLCQKVEPAGKIRVFAIVDYWSQMILRPVSDAIFQILRTIKQDGTFNQEGAVQYMRDYLDSNGISKVYSFDLSAATDRVPAILYQVLMDAMGFKASQQWKTLLTFRPWGLERGKRGTIMYAVGQPMGAYSSWGMLALAHHALVQFSWYEVGGDGWFTGYVVLGDDIVIADDRVAAKYQLVMSDLGVEISLAKSVLSRNGTFEFAKRISTTDGEVTPIPWKMVLDAIQFPSSWPQAVNYMVKRGFTISPTGVMKSIAVILGVPWSNWLVRPVGKLPRTVRIAFLTLFLPGYCFWRDFDRFVSVHTMTVFEISEAVRLNKSLYSVDGWTVMGWLKHSLSPSIWKALSPASWIGNLVRVSRELDRLSPKVPTWVIVWFTPLAWWIVVRQFRLIRGAYKQAVKAVKYALVERMHGINRPWKDSLREYWVQTWMESFDPSALDTDAAFLSSVNQVARLEAGAFEVLSPAGRSRQRFRKEFSTIGRLVVRYQKRLPFTL